MPRLPAAPDLDWTAEGVLRDAASGDVYFSTDDGLAEARLVFLEGCGLPEAWAGRAHFAVGELGFGTGLNALALLDLWARTRPAGATLHLVSIERALMDRADAARALAAFPALAGLADWLLAHWPVRAFAPQRLWSEAHGFALTVLQGEAHQVLEGVSGAFDAWFLDGFAPARNPQMWTPAVLARVAELSRPGARIGTYSVAGAVREGLAAAGFQVAKAPGHGRKRQRLEARLPGAAQASPSPRRALIAGAGLAGGALAQAFRRRGVAPLVLDAGLTVAAGASGNPAALLNPRLDRGGPLAQVHLAAYVAALAHYAALGPEVFTALPVERRGRDARTEAALRDLLEDPPLPPSLFGAVGEGACVAGGVVRPALAVARLLEGAEVRLGATVAALAPTPGGWCALGPGGEVLAEAEIAVLAVGPALADFAGAPGLPLRAIKGQIEWGPSSSPPSRALAAGTYAAPFADGLVFGATFERAWEGATTATAAARAENLAKLAALDAALAEAIAPDQLQSRASLRAVAPDHAPIAGPLGAGLFALGGLGARGVTLAPLLAETVVGLALDEPALLPAAALAAVSPLRFRRKHG